MKGGHASGHGVLLICLCNLINKEQFLRVLESVLDKIHTGGGSHPLMFCNHVR